MTNHAILKNGDRIVWDQRTDPIKYDPACTEEVTTVEIHTGDKVDTLELAGPPAMLHYFMELVLPELPDTRPREWHLEGSFQAFLCGREKRRLRRLRSRSYP